MKENKSAFEASDLSEALYATYEKGNHMQRPTRFSKLLKSACPRIPSSPGDFDTTRYFVYTPKNEDGETTLFSVSNNKRRKKSGIYILRYV